MTNLLPTASAADPLGGANSTTLAREPQLSPDEIGDGSIDPLEFPDPTEGLALVAPPEASNDGGAHLSYPLLIPKGRGITPDLSLEYDSGGDNGWLGQGWDLSVGDISVDTRWGAPYFDPNYESETYSLDGDMLIPNALGTSWEPRVEGDRQDYTRQVETQYEQIIRHEVPGMGTKGYFWEVHDKGGNVYWYGGQPDQGGPDGYNYLDDDPSNDLTPTIDRSAIVTDEHGNGVRWLLSAQRDVGVNQISYHYTTIHYQYGAAGWTNVGTDDDSCTPSDTVLCAKHTYLTSINYTEAADIAPAPDGDAEYEVVLTRDHSREDPVVDAMGGYVDLTVDRLSRVDVYHGDPIVTGTDAEGNETRDPRTYNQLTVRYNLDYGDAGAFGKSLLRSVSQVGSDGATSATHEFTYYDRVSTADGYDGFETTHNWNTGSDLPDRELLSSDVAIGALGSSESNSGEGHAYIGFNPIVPEKVGSFGGSLQIGGGATEAIAEWLDINGDGLPDKIYRDSDGIGGDLNDVNRNGPIRYRLNTSGPNGTTTPTFGDEKTVTGISRLSTEGNFGLEGAFEAFPGISIAFGLGIEVSWGDAYFTDANGDGLPDYVSGGTVWFNHLDANGVPTFVEGDSSDTPVPIDDTGATVDLPQDVQDIQDQLEAANPLVDTVRRWTAPFSGRISINAPVTLNPLSGSSHDGVRVAIQHDGNEIVAGNLLNTGSQAFTSPIGEDVTAGDDIYFRVGSVNDGANDDVDWSPTITYTKIEGVADADVPNLPTDVNGLSQITYVAADDFTLSGRPDTLVFMPFQGTVHFSATIGKLATTDDVKVVLTHNGVPTTLATLTAASAGQTVVSADVNVAAPVPPPDANTPGSQDSLSVKLVSDTPIDLHAIDWNPAIAYTSGVDRDGNPLPDPSAINFDMTPEIEQYPNSSPHSVSMPWSTGTATTRDAHLTFAPNAASPSGAAIVTVKTRNGVVARAPVTVPASPLGLPVSADADLNVALQANTDYWFDVTIRDPNLSDKVQSLTAFTLTDGTPANDIGVPATLHWTGRQGIFPLAYRGWAVAGYNAEPTTLQPNRPNEALLEDDFVIDIDENNQPTQPADPGWGDIGSADPSQDTSFAYLPAVQSVTIPGQPKPVDTPVWVGNRANLAASAAVMRSSRLGADSVTLAADASSGAGRAVTRVSLTVPSVKLAFGAGPFGASFGFSPSFGLVDYQDMNGDGYPDIITPSSVKYTTQRGAYRPNGVDPSNLAVTNQDLTFAVSFGIESGLVDIKANAKGKTNATQGGAAGKGSDADDSGGGISLGADINVSWTSPNASEGSDGSSDPNGNYSDQLGEISSSDDIEGLPGDTAPIQLGLADVNGDGLPDRVFTTPAGVFARYNLGYRFAKAPVKLSTGGFEAQESYAGGLSLGFSTPWAEFSGGAALNWNVDLSRYAWNDVNGDGILDQIHKIDGQAPTVRFGTGTGMLDATPYGNMPTANVEGINAGQQVALDRTNGLGGQFDFEIAIGPLCLVACYLIINPGASYQNSVSTTEVDLQDVNGDGYADSLQTLDDNTLTVGINKQEDTNLLATVANPLGGTMTMTYERDGNTVDNPDSVWDMASLEVDDGRVGDGADVRRTTFEYEGLKFDRLQRASLGYATVTETEVDTQTNPGTDVRETVHTYLNDNVFNSGLETSTKVNDVATGDYLHGVLQTWNLDDVRGTADLSDLNSVASLRYSIAPQLVSIVQQVGNGGTTVGQQSTTLLTYDDLGDVIHQVDQGEDDDPNDDVVADYLYSRESNGSSGIGAAGDQPHDRPSPIWNAGLCPTWVSLPVVITVSDGHGHIYRHRDGRGNICDNASVTHLEEDIGNGDIAETELTYDAWGSYDRIVYPVGQNGRRYSVQYVWDLDGHANIADVTEYDLDPELEVVCDDGDPTNDPDLPATAVDHFLGAGLCAADTYTQGLNSSALFDPLTNLVASRTDANGNTVHYSYDALGRLASVSSPVASDPQPLVSFEYFVAPDDPHAVAHHYDAFHPGNTIDTAAFADGVGRVVQTQQDARLFEGADQAAVDGVIVSGATFFDAFGRPVAQYNPTVGTDPLGTFEYDAPADPVNDPHTETVYDLWDLPNVITAPGDRVTTIAYEYGQIDPGGPQLYMTTETAPNGRQTVSFTDMRDVVRANDDYPAGVAPLYLPPSGATARRTLYRSDGMGQLLQVIDPTGFVTTHEYDLMGRRTATTTPDGGRVTFAYDADGQQTSKVTPNLRAKGQQIGYEYNLHRLTRVDYPGTADDVTYTYGGMGAPGNGAGQVVQSEDGSQIEHNVYDEAGNVVSQTTTMKLHAWTPTANQSKFTWTTQWQYDGLGRLKSMVYPDSERLAYDYDAGGQLRSIKGEEDGFITVLVGTDPVTGLPIYEQQPHLWTYKYLDDRQYDEFLRRRYDVLGNGATTELS
ncbi:MAG TPA: SpvB/TcaC N-terminal domain-containing protein, partial [Ilumatobacteraceae bacterium]|nr:SpvB/TcaC N-terminal domain-containing protein [Ilumatobacteraceae bacterium]